MAKKGEKAPEPKSEPCPHCGDLFSKQGLRGHISFTHGGTSRGASSEKKEPKPAAQAQSGPSAGAHAAGVGPADDEDDIGGFADWLNSW